MTRKLAVGVIATALLLSGGLVGVSFGGTGGIPEPQVIELSLDVCGPSCRAFSLTDLAFGRPGKGTITVNNDALFDVDGNRVGRHSGQCTSTSGQGVSTPWTCGYVITLKDGPSTDPGTITTAGIYGFDSSTFAVTGGTGAYTNVRGSATLVVVGDGQDQHEVLTLNLIP